MRRMAARGVGDARDAACRAHDHDVPIAEVHAIIDHFDAHPGWWQPQGLHYRVRSAIPGADPPSGWPMPSKQARDAQRDQRCEERCREERKRQAAVAAENEALERDYGRPLDALDDEQLRALVADVFPSQKREPSELRRGIARLPLLAALRDREEAASHA